MSLALLRFLAMTVGPSITAAARPAVTFLAIQLTVAGLIQYELATVPDSFAWLVSLPAIVVAIVLAALETAAKHDPDVAAVLRDLKVDNLTGAFGAFSVALLFSALGLPESEATALVEEGAIGGGGLLDATATAVSTDHGGAVQTGAIAGAVGLNLGLGWLRSGLLEFVDDFELGKLWARIETGGVVGVLVLLPFLPLVALAFMVLFAIGLVIVSVMARAASNFVDQRSRVVCDTCGYRVRVEASLCPECRTGRQPAAEPPSGLGAATDALRNKFVHQTR
jgi:hypothetical protein